MKKEQVFRFLFVVVSFGVITFPLFMNEDVLYITYCKSILKPFWNYYGTITIGFLLVLSVYQLDGIAKKIYDYLD